MPETIESLPQRRSIRLAGYDYSSAGLYFITVCCQNRLNLFGEIKNDKTVLNDTGEMIKKWYIELENKFSVMKCQEYIIMPNHIHFILQIVGADLRVCPNESRCDEYDNKGEHIGSPLHVIIQWFKTMTTNEYIRGVKKYNWQPFSGKLWQRNYYEHIIRDEQSYLKTSEYIISNPMNWEKDDYYA